METPTITHTDYFERVEQYTTQNTWLHDNKYTSGKNSLINNHFKLYGNIPRNGTGIVIWNKYDMVPDCHGFPAWGVKTKFISYVV